MDFMCSIHWPFVAEMFGGVGLFLAGVAAIIAVFSEWGAKKRLNVLKVENKELEDESERYQGILGLLLQQVLEEFDRWYPSEEGIVSKYPDDKELIAKVISERIGANRDTVAGMLDHLYERNWLKV